jgi:hypothetical protein
MHKDMPKLDMPKLETLDITYLTIYIYGNVTTMAAMNTMQFIIINKTN